MSKKTDYRLQYEVTRRVEAETHAKLLEEALTRARQPPPPAPPPPPPAAKTHLEIARELYSANPYAAAEYVLQHQVDLANEGVARRKRVL
jgi:hypothetical protein